MSFTLGFILSNLSDFTPKSLYHPRLTMAYSKIHFIDEKPDHVDPRSLYIGKASQMFDPNTSFGAGFFLINDCQLDFSKYNVTIVEFHEDTDLFALYKSVQEIFLTKTEMNSSSVFLLNSLVKGKGIKNMLDFSSRMMKNPFLLVTKEMELLTISSCSEITRSDVLDLIQNKYNVSNIFTPEEIASDIDDTASPNITLLGYPKNTRKIVGKIMILGSIYCYLILLETDQAFENKDIDIMGTICEVLSAEMRNSHLYNDLNKIPNEYRIIDLLNEKFHYLNGVDTWLKSIGWEYHHNYYVLTVSPGEEKLSIVIELLKELIEISIPSSQAVFYDNCLVVLINPFDEIEKENDINLLQNILAEYNLFGGISLCFKDLTTIRKFYLQSKTAQVLGTRLNHSNRVNDYKELEIYDIISSISESLTDKDLFILKLKELKDYDLVNSTDYYLTLLEYLRAAGNHHTIANNMFIHRNTVAYRLKKINEIIDLDLSDGETLFKLLFSYKILELNDTASTSK